MEAFTGAMLAGYGSPSEIERRERKASEAMGESNEVSIPKPTVEGRGKLEAAGVRFGGHVDGVCVRATLPAGWRIVRNANDPRHASLMDSEGKKRASIFRKNSGYDDYGSTHVV